MNDNQISTSRTLDLSPAAFYSDNNNQFSMKVGGTFFDVTTHFNAEGKQSVLEQFKSLILTKKLIG